MSKIKINCNICHDFIAAFLLLFFFFLTGALFLKGWKITNITRWVSIYWENPHYIFRYISGFIFQYKVFNPSSNIYRGSPFLFLELCNMMAWNFTAFESFVVSCRLFRMCSEWCRWLSKLHSRKNGGVVKLISGSSDQIWGGYLMENECA